MDAAGIERRIVTVLFADLVGFTSLSERLDPEDVAMVQDAYFGTVRETVGRYGGRLEKFIGDAAMAVFGVPRTRDDDAERAVRAGLALVSAVEQLGARLGLEASDLRLRVGVNTGEVVHAESGPDAGRVTGDTVNTAARLQTAAPPGGVLLGEATALAVAGAVETEPAGSLELKGKAAPVQARLARGVRPAPSRDHAMGALRAPILGREEELAALRAALERTRGGEAERWVVVAPPGVGKSRLTEEFGRQGASDRPGGPIWRARLRPNVLAPYEPVAQLLASALAYHGWEPTHPDAALRLGPVLMPVLRRAGVTAARSTVVADEVRAVLLPGEETAREGLVGAGEREQRFATWLEALDALAGEEPASWLVEDVHWAGGDLLAFLGFAGAGRSRSGRLILCTARPSILEQAPQWCEPSAETHLLHLDQLSSSAAEELVAALVGEALPPGLVTAIAQRSDGNPLFIEELLRTWILVGVLAPGQHGTWTLSAPADEVPLPATVQAIYAAQLDDLSPEARQAARRASVAGRRFPRDALEPLGVPRADTAIDLLSRRALVLGPFADPLLGRSHQFRHALLRDAGYASLARAERARLHVRLARWLEEVAGKRWAEVAEVIGNHYRAALAATPKLAEEVGDGIDRNEAARLAATWFERAASAAVEVAAHDAARTLLRQALDLSSNDDPLAKARRWHRLGDATAYVADMDEGARAYQTAADLSRQVLRDVTASADQRQEARSVHAGSITSLGLVRIQQLRFKEAVALADAALAEIGPAEDLNIGWLLYLRAWGTIAWAYQPGVKVDLERAMELATKLGDRRLELEVRFQLTSVAADEGTMTLADLATSDLAAVSTAYELGDWQRVCKLFRNRAHLLMETDRGASATALEEAAAVAEAHGLTEESAWTDYARTELGLISGHWKAAVAAGLRALDLADRNAYHRVQVRTWSALSPIARATGHIDLLERAARWFAAHEAIFPRSPFGSVLRGGVDVCLARAGLIDPPKVSVEDMLPAWNESQGLPSWHAAVGEIAGWWLERNQLDPVRRIIGRMAAWHDRLTTEASGRGSEALLRACLLLAEDNQEGSSAAATIALGEFRTSRAPWWIAKSIRAMEGAGGASPDLLSEAAAIEGRLGLAAPAR